jgi:hypothetical protein
MERKQKEFGLPLLVVGPADVARLMRELESLDDYLHQASLRAGGGEAPKLPKTSRMLDDFASTNELNFLHEAERQKAKQYLEDTLKSAPVLAMSFATDPSSAFVGKIIAWLRENIDHRVLLKIGLQPSIAAGCTLRTPNKYYDFSLREHFAQQRPILVERLKKVGAGS